MKILNEFIFLTENILFKILRRINLQNIFTFQVSANCGICVRYLIQSSFIISSLRPIFFRMYEIETPQIMHELFVHSTNKESLLRTDITDAHFVTWFGSITGRYLKEFTHIQVFIFSQKKTKKKLFSLA